jgi:hypothetical protein
MGAGFYGMKMKYLAGDACRIVKMQKAALAKLFLSDLRTL